VIEIYTDGACAGNPGPGGWGVVIIENGERRELHGGEAATTNNRMEMTAAIEALRATQGAERVALYTDSQYLRNGILAWIAGWKRNGWRTADKKPVKNKDLWEALDAERQNRKIDWHWVKAHAGDPNNERADELARLGCNGAGGTPTAGSTDIPRSKPRRRRAPRRSAS
jgi:ribonuclease HI